MKTLVTGATGLLGTALVAELRHAGDDVVALGSHDADLRDTASAEAIFARHRPEIVYHLAGRVRGIMGNAGAQGVAMLDNLRINTNTIEAARRVGVRKVIAMGSTAIYADAVATPMREDDVWAGPPHKSEAGYSHAKLAMLAQLDAYREQWGLDFAYCVCTNLFGPNDRFDERHGHVIPSLISKFHRAATCGGRVTVWGSGTPTRDFLHVGDAAAALRRIGAAGSGPLNVASGRSVSIRDVAEMIAEVAGYRREIEWDTSKPDGQLHRAYDVSRLRALGVLPGRDLRDGLADTYAWFSTHADEARR
ncbi:MAG: GDP-L-fucose synthase [Pseudomonadota bacterium]|nr:GDP-L-fucose synthase [Pseudomonadota bacterium]